MLGFFTVTKVDTSLVENNDFATTPILIGLEEVSTLDASNKPEKKLGINSEIVLKGGRSIKVVESFDHVTRVIAAATDSYLSAKTGKA